MFVPLVIVRLLSQEQLGSFKIFFLYVTMLPTFSFTGGLTSGLGYWAGQGQRGIRAIQLSNAMIFGAGLVLSLCALVASPWVAAWFKWPIQFALYLSVCILGAVCTSFLEESLIVTKRVWMGAAFLSGSELIRSIALLATAWVSHDLNVILLTYSLVSLAKVIASLVLGYRNGLVSFSIDRELIRNIWHYSLPVSMSGLCGVFSNYGDQLILSNVITPAEFAVYAVGCLAVPPLMILEYSVTRLMVPEMSEYFSVGNTAGPAQIYRRAVDQLTWILIPAVAGLIVFAHPIITLLFTDRYADSTGYLRGFALSYLVLCVPSTPVPRARGEGRWILKTALLFLPLPLILCYVFGLKFGAYGVLGGILVSRSWMKAYAIRYIRKTTGWTWTEFFPIADIVIFTLTSAALGGLCLALESTFGGGMKWFVFCGAMFVILYFPITLSLVNWHKHRSPHKKGEVTRVLLFTQHLRIGGLERVVLNLGQTLQQDPRWKIYVFSHDADRNEDSIPNRTFTQDFKDAKIPVDALKKKPGFSFKALYRLLKNIFGNEIDIVHTHDIGPLIYAVLANFIALGRVRIIHTQHTFVHVKNAKKVGVYERLFTLFVKNLTVVNDDLVPLYKELGVPESRVRVVHNGVSFVDAPVTDRKTKLARRVPLLAGLADDENALLAPLVSDQWILYMARFDSIKGQRAAPALWERLRPEIRRGSALILLGPSAEAGEREKVLSLFEGAPDREHVVFLDATKVPKEWLVCADLFLSCSKFEGMPLGPLEAIGSGLPAVLSAIPGHRFLDKLSLQFPLEQAEAGAHQIERALSAPGFGTEAYYTELWDRANSVREGYSLKAMADKYANLYAAKS